MLKILFGIIGIVLFVLTIHIKREEIVCRRDSEPPDAHDYLMLQGWWTVSFVATYKISEIINAEILTFAIPIAGIILLYIFFIIAGSPDNKIVLFISFIPYMILLAAACAILQANDGLISSHKSLFASLVTFFLYIMVFFQNMFEYKTEWDITRFSQWAYLIAATIAVFSPPHLNKVMLNIGAIRCLLKISYPILSSKHVGIRDEKEKIVWN